MSSSIDPSIPPLKPHYAVPEPNSSRNEPAHLQALIDHFSLQPHIEGGYFVETDRDEHRVPNPLQSSPKPSSDASSVPPSATPALPSGTVKSDDPTQDESDYMTTFFSTSGSVSTDLNNKLNPSDQQQPAAPARHSLLEKLAPQGYSAARRTQLRADEERARLEAEKKRLITQKAGAVGEDSNKDGSDSTRSASTTIHYLLTPASPLGAFHRNKGRTVHTLHKGRGRYVIIHADEVMGEGSYDSHKGLVSKARVETFVVGQDVLNGDRLQWIVDGGKYKASYLLPESGKGEGEEDGLLISETVVPGFEFTDHDFLRRDRFEALLTEEQRDELSWLVRRDG